MSSTQALWADFSARLRELRLLGEVRSVLTWDQQTQMPPGAGAGRGAQMAWLMQRSHEALTDPGFGDLLEALSERAAELDERQVAGVRNIRRTWLREVSVPVDLVARLGELQGTGFAAWMQAREAGDFSLFAPVLEQIVDALRERACAQSSGDPYATMIEEFDPGVRLSQLDSTFERLATGLGELLDAIRGAPALSELPMGYPPAAQLALARHVVGALGFDTGAGRLDQSEHPFTATLGPRDVRITTRVEEDDLLMVLGATIHETGHALYEQGLFSDDPDDGVAEAASMGLHESQSRFWENRIGRSLAFCEWLQGPMAESLGTAAPGAEQLYRACNRVQPGANRVTSDEVTYNLHIAVRYQLERRLVAGELAVADLPEAWNDAYARMLGVTVANDLEGVLQDVHWASGAIGYFPSYTLGNLYAASLARALESEMPDLDDSVARGEFGSIVAWLRERVHRHGHLHEAPELVRRVVGERDGVDDLLDHLWGRHGALHGVSR